MILIAGGTGRLGTCVVARLTAHGERVRVLTRDVSRAAPLRSPFVDVVRGDVRDPSTLGPALAGVRTVVSAVHGFIGPGRVTPASVDRDGNANLVAAAKAEGAELVLVSVVGAAAQSPMELFRMKAAAEQTLIGSGVPWTIVQAAGFLELYLDLMRRSAGKGGRPLVFGRGENPINFVPVSDVADEVVRVALDPTQRGRTVRVCGANMTLNELAALVQQELGTTGKRPRYIPRPVLRTLAASRVISNSALSRQAGAAIVMDTADMTAVDPRHLRETTG
jgi:NADH dehydrogenase